MSGEIQIIKKGVEYLADTSDRAGKGVLHIVFCHRDKDGAFINGVTTEVLLKVLMNRQATLVERDSSEENIQALLNIKQAYIALEKRKNVKLKKRSDHKANLSSIPAGSQPG